MSQALTDLRAATRPLHDRLEATLAINRPGAGLEDYRHYLEDMWGWLAAFEPGLRDAAWPAAIARPMRMNKLAWIEADLFFMQDKTPYDTPRPPLPPLPIAGFCPDLSRVPERYGVAYVIEGAQLGTRVLRRKLAGSLGEWSPRWLEGYGNEGPQHWRAFLAELEFSLGDDAARQAAAQAAADAFMTLAAWSACRAESRSKSGSAGMLPVGPDVSSTPASRDLA